MSISMKKKICLIVFLCLAFSATTFGFNFFASASGEVGSEIVVSAGDKSATIDAVNPITLSRNSTNDGIVKTELTITEWANKNYIYNGRFYNMYSYPRAGAVEYEVMIIGGVHKVTKEFAPIAGDATRGNLIPVPGYLLSLTEDKLNVNDILSVTNSELIPEVVSSIDNITSGVRLAVDKENEISAGACYLDTTYGGATIGAKTTREVSFDMILSGDNAGKFNVTSGFKDVTTVDTPTTIPAHGFVLSASNAVSVEQMSNIANCALKSGVVFSENDIVELSGKDYFGLDYEVSTKYDCLNPTPEKGFDFAESENRGVNQMMIYTMSVTGGGNILSTNNYGFEASVDKDGIITSITVNVGVIPEGGFVVSSHGTRKQWIKDYMKPACKVSYDDTLKIVTVSSTLESVVAELINTYDFALKQVNTLKNGMFDVDIASLESIMTTYTEKIERAKTIKESFSGATKPTLPEQLNMKFEINAIKRDVAPIKNKIEIYKNESRAVGTRSVWHVPNINGSETDLAGVKGVVSTLADCGINTVYLEVYNRGYSHFVSNVMPLDPDTSKYNYKGSATDEQYADYVSAFIGEANKQNIEVFAWVYTFYIGRRGEAKIQAPTSLYSQVLAGKKDDFFNYSQDGIFDTHGNAKDQIFADPANSEYRKMMTDYVGEMCDKFPTLSGVNLDYIRYPDKSLGAEGYDTGYTETAMNEFLAKYGYSFAGSDSTDKGSKRVMFYNFVTGNPSINEQWKNHRRNYVTEMVRDIKDVVYSKLDNGMISTATGPNAENAKNELYQDWSAWVREGLIDICTPMAYFDNAQAVATSAKQGITLIGGMAYNYVGISPYLSTDGKATDGDAKNVYNYPAQISACYNVGASGYSLFSSEQILGKENGNFTPLYARLRRESLTSGVNRNKNSISSHSSVAKVLEYTFNDMLKKADDIYIVKSGMTTAQKTALSAEFDKIKLMPSASSQNIYDIMKAVKSLKAKATSYGNLAVSERIIQNLDLLIANLDQKITRSMVRNGEWNPLVTEIRPSLEPKPEPPKEEVDNSWKEEKLVKSGCGANMSGISTMIITLTVVVAVTLAKRKSARK